MAYKQKLKFIYNVINSLERNKTRPKQSLKLQQHRTARKTTKMPRKTKKRTRKLHWRKTLMNYVKLSMVSRTQSTLLCTSRLDNSSLFFSSFLIICFNFLLLFSLPHSLAQFSTKVQLFQLPDFSFAASQK